MRNRRYFIGVLGATALAGLSARSAFAQQTVDGWPQWPVRVISPTATGGPGQNFRFYADNLKDKFGQAFVLENMPGGSGSVGCMPSSGNPFNSANCCNAVITAAPGTSVRRWVQRGGCILTYSICTRHRRQSINSYLLSCYTPRR